MGRSITVTLCKIGFAVMLLCGPLWGADQTIPPTSCDYQPLTGNERWHRCTKGYLFSPATYMASAGAALGGLITNDPKEWGQDIAGYGRQVASQFGLFTTQVAVHEGGDAILGLDPRYFHCECAGGWHRTWNALQMSFLAYNRNGHKRLDFPELAGAYGSGMLMVSGYPDRYEPLVKGVQQGHAQMGFVFGVNLIREFSPELKRFFRQLNPLRK
jgi:hypothetical protein